MHTVLIAMNDDTSEDQHEQVRAQLLTALPGLQLTFAHTLDDALRAPSPAIVITFGYPWLPDLVRERNSIEWIHLLSAGADRLLQQDIPFERLRISTSSGVHSATIGDYVMAGVLYHTKHLARFAAQQREHRWERGPQEELEGRTMAILGYGAIGRGIAVRAKAFGMHVIGVKRTASVTSASGLQRTPGDAAPGDTTPGDTEHVDALHGPDRLHEVLAQADVLAVTLPLTAATRGLIGRAEFDALKPGAILVNVGRGHVVDEHAMLAALRDGRLRAATLDVFADEPLPSDSPLWDRDDVLITPHVAGDTPAYMRKATQVFIENYVTWQREGRLTTEVDVARGY